MHNLFGRPKSQYEMVGRWPGIEALQGAVTSGLQAPVKAARSLWQPSLALWQSYLLPSYLDVTSDPLLQQTIEAAQGPALAYYQKQQQQALAPWLQAGLTFSSGRQAAMTELAGEQAQQLANLRYGYLWPERQRRAEQQWAASQMWPQLQELFARIAAMGTGTPVQVTYGASPFDQLLQAATVWWKATHMGGG